jgi:oligopeptide transport system ATP-binding protein
VSIARALALRPSLIVADEPTSALDVSVRAQILNLMQDLQREHGLSYVFISHDLSVVRHMSDLVAVMYLGKVVELADRDTLYVNPQHPYTQALLSVVPIPDPAVERTRRRTPIQGDVPNPAHPPRGCNFNTRCPFAFDRCFVEEPPLYDVGTRHHAACFLAKPEPEAGRRPGGNAPDRTRQGH